MAKVPATSITEDEVSTAVWNLRRAMRKSKLRKRHRPATVRDQYDAYVRPAEQVEAAATHARQITGEAQERDIEIFTGYRLDGPHQRSADHLAQDRLDRDPPAQTHLMKQGHLL